MGTRSALLSSSESSSLTSQEVLWSASLSSFMTRCVCQPIDVIKIRMQVEDRSRTRATLVLYNTVSKEGLRALWKGHVSAQGLSVVFSATQFVVFDVINKSLGLSKEEKKKTHFLSGAVAGLVATITSYPLDVARTRLVVRRELGASRILTTRLDCFRGLLPSLMAIGPNVGLQFGLYSYLTSSEALESILGPMHFLGCGALAGLVAKTVVFPLDTIKKRLQVQNLDSVNKNWANYKGIAHCHLSIWQSEGVRGFYKGWVPGIVKATIASAAHFAFYELVAKAILALRPRSKGKD